MKELLLVINVTCREAQQVKGKNTRVVMIPFEAEAIGPAFRGRSVGTGVDTQTITSDGAFTLSARYMLEGTDAHGNPCRLFIENNGSWEKGFRPLLVSDSPELCRLEDEALSAEVEGREGGVKITIYKGE